MVREVIGIIKQSKSKSLLIYNWYGILITNFTNNNYNTLMYENLETQNIEYKSSWRDEYLDIIASFANTNGGELIIGVDDNGKVLGVRNANKLLVDIPNKIINKLNITPSVDIRNINNREVIVIRVIPSLTPISIDGTYFVRSGSRKVELKNIELANFLLRKLGKTWDEYIEERANLNDINIETIENFKKYSYERIPSIIEENDLNIILEKLNLLGDGRLKRAAVLLFAKNPQRFYINSSIRIGKFKTETEILTNDIVEGNLFEQLENCIEILRTKYLMSEIKFEGIHRREILEYPLEALREAIINALIHRDYLGTSDIQIRIYQDKLVIMNDGVLPPEVPIDRLKTEHISKPRNVLLAYAFNLAGFIEKWGMGTLKMIESCKEQDLPEPDFIEEEGIFKVIFYKDIYTIESLQKLGLNERQIKAVMYVKEIGKITNKKYQEKFKTSERTATRNLNDLVIKDIFERIGTTGKGVTYILRRHKEVKDAIKKP